MAVMVDVDGGIVDLLVRSKWLSEHEAGDKQAIGCAIAALLAAAKI